MANEQNLKPPFTSDQSREEAAKNGRKGGIASGQAKRDRKNLRLALEMLLEKDFKDKAGNTLSGTEVLTAKLFEKATKGDVKAFIALRDTVGQAPTQKVEVEKIEKKKSVDELRELFDEQ